MLCGDENYDLLYKFWLIFDFLNEIFLKVYDLVWDLIIDESMVGFKVYIYINIMLVY